MGIGAIQNLMRNFLIVENLALDQILNKFLVASPNFGVIYDGINSYNISFEC